MDKDRINGIVNAASHAETLEQAHSVIERSTVNYSQHVVDEAVRVNADFQYEAGLNPKVIRKTNGKCCDWCKQRAGKYDYEDVKATGNDVWQRHLGCKCIIEYDPGDGKTETVNNYRRRKNEDNSPAELLKRRLLEGLPDDRASDKIAARKALRRIQTIPKPQGSGLSETAMQEQLSESRNSDILVDAIINNHEDLESILPKT